MRLARSGQILAVASAAKLVTALAGALEGAPTLGTRSAVPLWITLSLAAAFGLTALYLAVNRRRDRRAVTLALAFLLVATAFSDRLILRLEGHSSPIVAALSLLASLQLVALLPRLMWTFFQEFPRVEIAPSAARLPRLFSFASLIVGFLLLVANAGFGVARFLGRPLQSATLLRFLDRQHINSLFWPLLLILTGAALVFGLRRLRLARIEERRRVQWLVAALLAGSGPIVVIVVVTELWAPARAFLVRPDVFPIAQVLVLAPLLLVPLATAYAVQVHQALDVRLFVRKAVQYGLARYSLLCIALLPLLALGAMIYLRRDNTVVEILGGGVGPVLGALAFVAVALLLSRRRITELLDRRFFREQYDSRRILRNLVDGCRRATDIAELERLITSEIDRALHLERAGLLSLDPVSEAFVASDNRLPRLALRSRLAARLAGSAEAVVLDPAGLPAVVADLPAEDRRWLTDSGARLLVPISDSIGTLIGICVLGDRRSELPFSEEDRGLLSALMAAASPTLQRLVTSRSGEYHSVERASECPSCRLLQAARIEGCRACGRPLAEANVPLVLGGKFRLMERIGSGGMGVVYRAKDLSLARDVAIKTLPRVATEMAWRLRREARAMASVSHLNLAAIHGLEAWNGRPMLIVEYLAGGTLASRIEQSALPAALALDIGLALAEGLGCLHRHGMLHRDIKPSNIAFSADQVPKLLDFGLARMVETGYPGEGAGYPPAPVANPAGEVEPAGGTITGAIMGTPGYLSPEAAVGAPADLSFDLWGLSLSLYEAIAGSNWRRAGQGNPEAAVPDLAELAPDSTRAVADFFARALAWDRAARPRSAADLAHQLRELRAGF